MGIMTGGDTPKRTLLIAVGALLTACSSSATEGPADAASDSPAVAEAGPEAGGQSDDAEAEADMGATGADAGKDAAAEGAGDSAASDAQAPHGPPITGLTAGTWVWVPFPEALCRDGSSTGIGINLGTSNHLLIFMEGGGACFNASTCGVNTASFGVASFGAGPSGGILDRTSAANPVKDWSFVYVPYCTGDLHAGNSVATVPGASVPPQHFVGYTNVGLYLDRVVPTFASASRVLLAGVSSGGWGAALNYVRVAKAFGTVPVTLLDDSGPFMQDPYLATCLQSQFRSLWGLDGTVQSDCGGDCTTPGSFFLDAVKHAATAYPSVSFGLADSTGDSVSAYLYGYGSLSCTSTAPLTAVTYAAGLQDIRTQLASRSNYGEFLFAGTTSTSIHDGSFFTRTSGSADGGAGISMTDWVAALLGGTATNTGP